MQILFHALYDHFYASWNLYRAFVRLVSNTFPQLHICNFNRTNSSYLNTPVSNIRKTHFFHAPILQASNKVFMPLSVQHIVISLTYKPLKTPPHIRRFSSTDFVLYAMYVSALQMAFVPLLPSTLKTTALWTWNRCRNPRKWNFEWQVKHQFDDVSMHSGSRSMTGTKSERQGRKLRK